MQTARIFTDGESQAVSLPKEFWFAEEEVVIKRIGGMVILLPMHYRAENLLGMLEEIGPMEIRRGQPAEPQRQDFGYELL